MSIANRGRCSSSWPEVCQQKLLAETESSFGANDRSTGTKELEERPAAKMNTSKGSAARDPRAGTLAGAADGDIDFCREYGYKYDYDYDEAEQYEEEVFEEGVDDDDEEDEGISNFHHSNAPFSVTTASGAASASVMPSIGVADASSIMRKPLRPQRPYPKQCQGDSSDDNKNKNNNNSRIFLMGRSYHSVNDYTTKRNDEMSLFWFTYRCNFPEIVPYGITSDAGWGCMLRSAQMLLGQALKLHYCNQTRNYLAGTTIKQRKKDAFVRQILTWFGDFPSSNENLYSLHNMVAAGLLKYEKLPGEWYGPGTACYVLRDLVSAHEHKQKRHNKELQKLQQQQQQTSQQSSTANSFDITKPMFRVYVASQGSIYKDEIYDLMTADAQKEYKKEQKKKEEEQKKEEQALLSSSYVTDFAFDHPLASVDSTDQQQTTQEQEEELFEWDTALLLLIPLRLGLNTFNTASYSKSLAHVFSLYQSVGVLGGRPRGARWFYGATSNGTKVYGLDPHTIQNAPTRCRRKKVPSHVVDARTTPTTMLIKNNNNNKHPHASSSPPFVINITDDYVRSIYTTSFEVFPISKMDPSIALGFYCHSQSDLDHLIASMKQYKQENPNLPELFTIAEKAPDYAATDCNSEMMMAAPSSSSNNNNNSNVNAIIEMTDSEDAFADNNGCEDSDDEYVFL